MDGEMTTDGATGNTTITILTTLPEQLHTGSFEGWAPDPVCPIGFLGDGPKPMVGFWTSTRSGPGRSAWVDWCHHEGGRAPRLAHRFAVVGAPRILVVRDDDDLRAAAAALGVVPPVRRETLPPGLEPSLAAAMAEFLARLPGFPWDAVAERWDAVHVPADHWRASLLSTWDCESTVWFRPHAHLAHLDSEPAHQRAPRRRR